MTKKVQDIEIKFPDGSVSIIDEKVYALIREFQAKIRLLSDASVGQRDGQYSVGYKEIENSGATFFLPNYALHRPAVAMSLRGEIYEPQTHLFVRKFFEQIEGSMVHAGTFFGDMLPSFSKSVSRTVYAFEPVLENFILAKLCVEKNQLENVVLQNSALSDEVRNLRINTTESERHAGGKSFVSQKGSLCSASMIDSISDDGLVLLHLDIEGHELLALKGAIKTIKQNRPVILIEDNQNNCETFLNEVNYELFAKIPELNIWVPSDQERYKQVVQQIIG